MTDSGLAVLGRRLSQNKLPRLGKGLMTGLNACLPYGFRIEGGRHEPHDYVRAAAEYAYAVAPAETKRMVMPSFNNMAASCRTLLGLMPARHFNDANPDVVEAVVSGAMRYFRLTEIRIDQSTDTLEVAQSVETENRKPSEHLIYQSRDCVLPPSPTSEPTTRLVTEPTNGKVVDTSQPQREVIVIGSSPERKEDMNTSLRSIDADMESHRDHGDMLYQSSPNEVESDLSDRLLHDGDESSVSRRQAPFGFRRVPARFVKQEKSSESVFTKESQKKAQWQQGLGLRMQEKGMISDGDGSEHDSKNIEQPPTENNRTRKHKVNGHGTMTLQNSNAARSAPKQNVELTEQIQYGKQQPSRDGSGLQDLQHASEQAATKSKAPTSVKENQMNKVRQREEVILDLTSGDDVRTSQPAKKRKLDTHGVQRPTTVQRQRPAAKALHGEPRIAAHARAPKPPIFLPMIVNGRVINPLHPDYEDSSTSSSSSDDDASIASVLQTSCSQTSACKSANPTPRQVSATNTILSSHARALLSNPPEARADIDPASQLKTSKVFTVDVQEKLAQRRANRIKFLEQVLEEAGVDDDQLDQIEQRLKMKDSLKNAFDAVVKRRNWMRKK